MAKGIKVNQGTSTVAGMLAAGAAVSLVTMLIGVAICASMILAGTVSEASAGYCAIGILLLSAVAGAAAAIGKREEKRLYLCLAAGAIYLLVLLSMTAAFFDGQYQGVAVTAVVIFGGSVLAVLLPKNRGIGAKSRRSKKRHR